MKEMIKNKLLASARISMLNGVDSLDENILKKELKENLQKRFELEDNLKEVREKINNFDVFKEFTFPLMKRDVEQQVKSSIDYEWRKSIKEPLLKILDKENNNV